MAGDKWGGFVLVDWERSAGHPAAIAGTRASGRDTFHRDEAIAP